MRLKPTRFNRAVLMIGGAVMFMFAARELTTPRARYLRADPEPGSNLPSPPSAVTVSFSEPLADESAIDVISTVVVLPSGEKSYGTRRKVTTTSGIDPNDPRRSTLRAELESGLPTGLYRVDWRVYAARDRGLRFGSFSFGVGTRVPVRTSDEGPGGLRERDYRRKGRQSALVGGIALIVLAVVLPSLPRKR